MKTQSNSNILTKYLFRGVFIGVLIWILIYLVNLDSAAFRDTNHTIADMFYVFPAMWVVTLLPVILGIIGYGYAYMFVKRIERQKKYINRETKRSETTLKFIDDLRKGSYDMSDEYFDKKDDLTVSLFKLRDYLLQSKKEQELQHIEEEQRNWVTQGLAQFGENLRVNTDNLELFSYNIIRYLVNYLKINQGGVYLANEQNGEKYFELTACVAFDRKKYADKKINWNEGLIGRAAIEKQYIYITDIPNDYVTITSGLGQANPKALLIVPLLANEQVHGVIELASFSEFQQFEIDFVERTAESLASTISSVKINMKTAELLKDSQMQRERMLQQEEELRQNLEEMRATQEDSDRREIEMKGILEAIDNSSISCEFATDGTLLSVNQMFLKTFKYMDDEIEDQNIAIFFFQDDVENLNKILDNLQNGINYKGRTRRRTKLGEEIYLLSNYTPVMDSRGNIIKILSLEMDITEQVKMEEQMKKSKEELGLLLEQTRNEVKDSFKEMEYVKIRNEKTLEGALDAIITINELGVINFFNLAAEKLWGYERKEVLGQQIEMLFALETIKNNDFVKGLVTDKEKIIVGERREVPIKNKFGEEIPVLFLISDAKVGDQHSYTAFIQNVEVELF